jgi:hypothetical protein
MGKGREPQIILKSDQRNILVETGREGKFTVKSNGWDENRVLHRGRQARGGGQERPLGADPPAGR